MRQVLPLADELSSNRRTEAEAKLLIAAMELVAEQGVARTSLASIGERAGFSRGIVNHHFGSKMALIYRLVEEAQQAFSADVTLTRGLTGLDAVLEFADAYLRGIARGDLDRRAFLVMWAEAAGASPELRPVFVAGDCKFREAVTSLVRSGIDDQSIRSDVEPGAIAVSMLAQLRGTGLQLAVDPPGFDFQALRPHTIRALRASLATRPQE